MNHKGQKVEQLHHPAPQPAPPTTISLRVEGKIEVFHHIVGGVADNAEILRLLRVVVTQGERMASQQQEALDALQKIDEATNKAAEAQTATATALSEVSDDLDDLIRQAGSSVPADVLQKLKDTSAKIEASAEATRLQSEFSKALAGKWQTNPVPVPPPEPEPPPLTQ